MESTWTVTPLVPQLSASFCLSTGTESLFQAKSAWLATTETRGQPHFPPSPHLPSSLSSASLAPQLVSRILLPTCTELVPDLEKSPHPLLLPFPLPATPVFANQLTACSVIAHEKTWVQMWWGDRGAHKMRFLFSKQTPKFNYSLNKRLLKPSSLCCCSSPHCLLALHY